MMQNLLQKIQKTIQTMVSPGIAADSDSVKIAQLKKLAAVLTKTQNDELGCEEVYAFVDQYADLMIEGKNAGILMPLVEHHLDVCTNCCEEYEMLLSLLQLEETS